MTSLAYVQQVYADETQPLSVRLDAAKAALPYEFGRKPQKLEQDLHVHFLDALKDVSAAVGERTRDLDRLGSEPDDVLH